ncbi:MAG: hypothetical protein A3B70_03865 [Deltaproteobacteria bacterium RIFCSPHIGHO2_02_FULL_40_11]|nr:MAG: hypothetical protein A3B70_03865 [Deltaproteobacteria bacterium RIFCSPHIGHO2_02_FULL_40_11]
MIQKFQNRMVWIVGGFMIFTSFFTLFGQRGLIKIFSLKKQHHAILKKSDFLEADTKRLQEELQKMKKEYAFQEHSARETLGFVQNDELIYEFKSNEP